MQRRADRRPGTRFDHFVRERGAAKGTRETESTDHEGEKPDGEVTRREAVCTRQHPL